MRAGWTTGTTRSTVLTGVIGQGEGDQPPHPHAASLSRLLIERGADPFDTQALYNTSLTARRHYLVGHPLDPIRATRIAGSLASGAETQSIGGAVPLNALDYLLGKRRGIQSPQAAPNGS